MIVYFVVFWRSKSFGFMFRISQLIFTSPWKQAGGLVLRLHVHRLLDRLNINYTLWQSGCLTLKETVVELLSAIKERNFYSTSSFLCTCYRSALCDWLFYSEDGIHIFLRNVGKLLPGWRASHLTRQSPWETPISHATFVVSQITWFRAITLGLFLQSLCSRHQGLGFQEVTVLECLLTPHTMECALLHTNYAHWVRELMSILTCTWV